MRISKRMPCLSRQKYAIVVDGECEFWYIQMLKRNERSINVNLEPKIPQKKKLVDQFGKVIELSKDYHKVFWVIDFDVIIKETRETKKGNQTILNEFTGYSKKIEEIENIEIIINNPCLEYWFLLHFESISKYFESCDFVIGQLKMHECLSNYEKTEKYYTKQDNDIYLKLKPYLSNAIINANKLTDFDLNNPETGISQMQYFFESEELQHLTKQ